MPGVRPCEGVRLNLRAPSCGSGQLARGGGRRWVGWVLLMLGVLVAGAWVASGWWQVWLWTDVGEVKITAGQVSLLASNNVEGTVLLFRTSVVPTVPADRGWKMWPEWGRPSHFMSVAVGALWYVRIPLWMLLIPIGGAEFWRRAALRRSARPGVCAACGYDLSGLAPGSACPECGESAGV